MRIFGFILLAFVFSNLSAQNPSLTKEETVNYLNKKANEILGHYRLVEGTYYYYYSSSVNLSGSDVSVYTLRGTNQSKQNGYYFYWRGSRTGYPCNYYEDQHTNTFNPAHIISIDLDPSNVAGNPVGLIRITLKSNTARYSYYRNGPAWKVNDDNSQWGGHCYAWKEYASQKESRRVVYFTFLQSDDTNFNKIRKAFEHLRSLLKAEDDPFGE